MSTVRLDRARKLGKLVKRWRLERGLNRNEALTELNKLGVDISYGYLNKLESGDRSLASASIEIREGIRTMLGISREEWERETGLYTPPLEPTDTAGIHIPGGLQLVPVVGAANGGRPHEYSIPVRRDLVRSATRAFQVEGSSMDDGTEDGIRDGDWVLVDTSMTDLENGRVYLIEVIGDGMTVKRLRRVGRDWLFLSDNPEGESFREADARVLGQVYGKVSYGRVR
jgi:SOS-response transcriptional repressor LexA